MRKRNFRDFYGCTGEITEHRDGTASYKVCSRYGNKIAGARCKTPRAARVALGRCSDCWEEVRHEQK